MASTFLQVPLTEAHIRYVAEHMREEDARECMRSHGDTPYEALFACWHMSMHTTKDAYAALDDDGVPVVCWGIIGPDKSKGYDRYCAWMLGTQDGAKKHPVQFWRSCKEGLPVVLKKYPHLFNFIDAGYGTSIRWAMRLGFDVKAPQRLPWMDDGLLFCEVTIDGSSSDINRRV